MLPSNGGSLFLLRLTPRRAIKVIGQSILKINSTREVMDRTQDWYHVISVKASMKTSCYVNDPCSET